MPSPAPIETREVSWNQPAGNLIAVRNPLVVRREIDALAERRASVWSEGVERKDGVRAEVQALNARIEELWLELRTIRASLRAGSHEQIRARARRAARAEQELRRRLPVS